MGTLGNILWFLLVGLVSWLSWIICGVVLCITIIGIPAGLQCFKLASLSAFPFGKDAELNFDKHPIMNIIWVILFGWEFALSYLLSALLFAITIIGIPFAKQCLKLAKLSLLPFGACIVTLSD
ncbi:MAG: YccF domain-containing protein [Clostridia bacterium]|nr:YccF domain-containing protein [Clostridia bacterium]